MGRVARSFLTFFVLAPIGKHGLVWVDGGFLFLGIGFALVKQLVGVDIGFTPLAVR
jgi:hypothetical protein